MKDLFGNEVDLPAMWDAPLTCKKKRKRIVPSGHAWTPGTGPAGETCGTCKHLVAKRLARTYHKCELTQAKWTGGPRTDVRVKDAACKYWEKDEGNDTEGRPVTQGP